MELTSLESNWNNQMCRICASNSNSFIPIFEGDGLEHQLPLKIQKYLPIEVSENDSLPRIMCFQCASTLISWNELVVKCIEADKKLRKYLNDEPEETKDSECFGESTAVDSDAGDDITGDNFFEEDKKPIPSPTPVPKKETNVKGRKPKLKRKKSVSDKETGNKEADLKEQEETDIIRCEFQNQMKNEFGDSIVSVNSNVNKSRCLKCYSEIPLVKDEFCHGSNLCLSCLDRFQDKELFIDNKSLIPNPETKEKLECKSFRCLDCRKFFSSKDSFLRHQRIHSGEMPYTCHICGKQFRVSGGLLRHLKDVHVGIKNFTCNVCSRTFASKATRDDHVRIHTGERPFVCDICGKCYKSKAALYIHSKTHVDSFPFSCTYCEKRFRRKQELLAHITVHTGEKIHKCELCFKSFRVKGELLRHKLLHSEEKPFKCMCGLSFRQKRYLKNHHKLKHSVNFKECSSSLSTTIVGDNWHGL